jgi:hypothetical protein
MLFPGNIFRYCDNIGSLSKLAWIHGVSSFTCWKDHMAIAQLPWHWISSCIQSKLNEYVCWTHDQPFGANFLLKVLYECLCVIHIIYVVYTQEFHIMQFLHKDGIWRLLWFCFCESFFLFSLKWQLLYCSGLGYFYYEFYNYRKNLFKIFITRLWNIIV